MSTDHANTGPHPNWSRVERGSLIAAVVGGVVFVALAFTPVAGPHGLTQAALSYSVAFHFWSAVTAGSVAVLMVHYLSGGAWGVLIRPVLETGARMMVLVAVLFIPVAAAVFFGSNSPYPWARPLEEVAGGSVLDELRDRTWLLNPAGFVIRSAFYLGCWFVLAYLLRTWGVRWRRGDQAAGERLTGLAGPGLVLYGVTVTFAAVDWVMSLEPFWKSTMYPPIYGIGQVTAGFAFTTATVIVLSRFPPLAGRVTPKHLRDLGGLLLTFVMLWAYFVFAQFMLIWVGNLPDETPYYLKRFRDGWEWVALTIITLHFAAPFVLLLFRGVKDNPGPLLSVAVGVLVIRFVDVLWWVEGAFPHDCNPFFWVMDVSAAVAMGGLWLWWFTRGLQRRSLEPAHGPSECETEASGE